MKTIKFALVAISFAGLMLSCSTQQYYQIAQTKPLDESIVKNDNNDSGYYYEDANCRISYDFWSKNGDAGFSVYNKTNQVLYILKDKTFFVQNGVSRLYYGGRTWVDVTAQNYSNRSTQVRTTEQPILAIAPHTSAHAGHFAIDQHVIVDCDFNRLPKKNEPATIAFTPETTPITFGNVITYRVGDKGDEKIVENMFYTNRVTNYLSTDLIRTEYRKNCPNVSKMGTTAATIIRFAPPTGYYQIYTK